MLKVFNAAHHRLELLHQERLVDVAVAQVVLDGLRDRRRLGLDVSKAIAPLCVQVRVTVVVGEARVRLSSSRG